MAQDLESSLVGFFRAGGLSLATVLLASQRGPATAPVSIVRFITQVSAKYKTILLRRAFSHVALQVFVDASDAEREYLGRLAHGFFAFHALGVFGDAAVERMKRARETVWLIDSNLLVPLLAVAAPSNAAFVDAFRRLRGASIRTVTLEALFREAVYHFEYAVKQIDRHGTESPYLIAAATGQPPYRRQNQFLQGFIRWRDAGGESDWDAYVHSLFGTRSPTHGDIERRLSNLGVEVMPFAQWPGFSSVDFGEQEEARAALRAMTVDPEHVDAERHEHWLEGKLPPEAAALVVVRHERDGRYHWLSKPGEPSPAYFISSTSLINAVSPEDQRITWQPLSFLGFVGSLLASEGGASADRAFEVLLWSVAASGANPIPERTIERVFGQVVDQTSIDPVAEQKSMTRSLLRNTASPAM